MGWTHSWSRPTELHADAFRRASRDCRALMAKVNVPPLAGFDGTGKPIFGDDAIVFNGVAPEACEPFEIHQTEFDRRGLSLVSSFCKTNHAGYDLWVQVALIILKHHLSTLIAVSSDGKGDDWKAARTLCQKHLGYGNDFTLEQN